MKILFTFSLLYLFTLPLYASSAYITPADKEKIFRRVGDSVFAECKKQSPFSTNCIVDCGNGRRFRKASGYCYYLSSGTFLLKVSSRYRNKNYHHTATVKVREKFSLSQEIIQEGITKSIHHQPASENPIESVYPHNSTVTNSQNVNVIRDTRSAFNSETIAINNNALSGQSVGTSSSQKLVETGNPIESSNINTVSNSSSISNIHSSQGSQSNSMNLSEINSNTINEN